ncbi:sensory neuron membrane protein 2-like [Zerene cesonia]|uniref:sensory neuron membrane protein 2-like n=1 Tax=Zerene cesonia TaxID=33412 RepID=UPI0018E5A069|nr:sensory neuron membrane protein 2-like [Zerene cesonia]
MLGKNAKLFFGLSVCALIVSIILAVWGFPKIVSRQIQKGVQLDKSSEMFEKWRKLPMPLHFKVYLFNVTNVDDIMAGRKPVLNEVGPFVYKEYRERTILGYGDNDTIEYTMKKTFVYDKEASGGLSDDQEVTIINYSYMNAILTAHDLMPGIIGLLNSAMGAFFSSEVVPFVQVKAKDLFFDGIYLNCALNHSALALICGKIKADTPPVMRPSEDKNGFYFSMFNHLNNTDLGPYSMVRGTENIGDLGRIVAYKNQSNMPQWKDPYCGMINGSDGSIFPPVDGDNIPQKLYTFEAEVCRSFSATYVGRREVYNMSALYYEIDKMAFAAKSANPGNKCFCQKNWSSKHDGCLMMGLMNLMPCKGAPAILSLPHFYLASEELLDYFDGGIKPDHDKHTSFVYMDPKTGVVLEASQRIQFNIELRNIADVPQLQTVPTGLFPLLWIEEGASVPEDLRDELQRVHTILDYVEVARWLILVGCALACVFAAVCVARSGVRVWPRNNHFVLNPTNINKR